MQLKFLKGPFFIVEVQVFTSYIATVYQVKSVAIGKMYSCIFKTATVALAETFLFNTWLNFLYSQKPPLKILDCFDA